MIDTATNAVFDIQVTTTRKHDTQIAPQVLNRNAASIVVLTGDNGHDDQTLCDLDCAYGIRPLITPRECPPLHKTWSTRIDSNLYIISP